MLLGIVLAGGDSRRMGKDKGLLCINGHSQLERTRQILRALGCDNVLISRNQDLEDLTCIPDIYENKGPLSGIHACLEAAGEAYDEVVITPVDMPLLGIQPLQQILFLGRSCDPLEKQYSAYLAEYYLPCYMQINTTVKQIIINNLRADKLSIRELHHDLNALETDCNLPEQLLNTNTPAQWQEALEKLR